MNGPRFGRLFFAAGLLAVNSFLLGQGTLGSISGRVTDPSGGVLPNVSVSLTNQDTGQQKKVNTSADGYYRFPDLRPGNYTVKAELTGFQAAVTSSLKVDVNQAVTNDISLQVGEVTTSVEVQAAAPLLQREAASTGQVITTQQILEIPLNGRNFLNLALLVPGASENPGAQSQFSINGMRGNETSMLFDGVDARLFQNGRPAMIPSVDALQEFKIQQNSYSAAYGNGTAVVNSALRSGTNEFHGDAWEFLRNDALDTRGFFDPSVPKLKRNQFGFTAGGPIRKNKTFFFANYEGLRARRSTTSSALIPTPAELGGNLSDGPPIFDPLTLDAATGKRQPFANNIIPSNRVSQFAHAAANIYPQPNLVGVKGFNYAKALSNPENTNQVNFKVDHQFSEKDAFFARFSRSTDNAVIDSALPLSGEIDDTNGMQALAHETHTFSPTLLNELTLGYTYGLFRQGLPLADHPIATQDFGLQGLRISGFNQGMPLLNIAGLSSMGSASFRPFGGIENNYQLGDDVTWIRGRHQIKFGAEFRQYRPSLYDQATPNGILNFDNRFTRQPGVNGTGNSIADFVLGDAFSGRATELIASNGTANMRWTHYSAYIQDDFKVMPKLTLNLGLRYDYDSPFREVYGAANVWSQTQNQFLTPGKGIDGLTKPDRNNFAPRFGLAYSATSRTVVRAGFGVFYGFIRGQEISSGYHLDPPFNVDTTLNSDPLTPTLPGVLWPPAVSTVTPGTNIFSINYDFPANYTYQWNFTVQRELTKNLSFQTAYVGSSSHKLTGRDLINQAHADADPTHPTPVQGRRPFTGAADISITKNIDQANYNALQVTVEKRTSQGLSFLGAYTYSKALGISEGGDQSAIGNEYVSRHTYYGSLPYDQRQRLTLSSTWELPLGRGKRFGNSVQGPLDKLISGWNATGIGTFFTGEHATPSSSNDPNAGRVDRNVPNRIGNGNLDRSQRSITRWFDTSAFVSQPFGTFGDSGSGILQMPGVNNVDLALLKDTVFHERYRVEFRSEFFNAFNHPSFGQPNLTAGSASFGIIRSQRTNPREIQFGLKFYW